MFYPDSMVKKEEDPFGTFQPDCTFFNHCITNFYDQDSEQDIPQHNCTPQDVMCYLEHVIDICDTPLNNILQTVHNNPAFKDVDIELLKRKILKQKNKLKRQRAKNRKTILHQKRVPMYAPMLDEQEEEYKKQRNRISAQISRDRKKQKVKALEQLNRQLLQECKLQKEENQRLKRQAWERNKQTEKIKGPFARMLIFLGIFFLFTVVRDIFDPSESNKTIAKIQKNTENMLASKDLQSKFYPEHPQVIQQLEETLTETIEDKTVAVKLKEGLHQKLKKWWELFGSKQQSLVNPMTQLSLD